MTIPYTFESYKKIYSHSIKGKSHPLFNDRKIRSYQSQINLLRKKYPHPRTLSDQKKIDSLISKKGKRIEKILLDSAIEAEKIIKLKELPWSIRYLKNIKDRKIYTSNNAIPWTLAVLQAQNDIAKHLPLTPNSRDYNVSNLINILNTQADITIIKIDIKRYYDSINHKILKKKIQKLDIPYLSKQIALQFIESFAKLEQTKQGIPQGISLSNYLAELYLQEFDDAVKIDRSVLYYSRYVDDIIIVLHENLTKNSLTPKKIQSNLHSIGLRINDDKFKLIKQETLKSRLNKLQEEISEEARICKKIKESKKFPFPLLDDIEKIEIKKSILENLYRDEFISFTYLGYQITPKLRNGGRAKRGRLNIYWYPDLPNKKIKSIINKIDRSFDAWDKSIKKISNSSTGKHRAPSCRANADYLLILRLRYISCNFRLPLKKSHIVVGFYQSNKQSLCKEFDSTLLFLDTYLQEKISERLIEFSGSSYQKNLAKLQKISFESSYKNREFIKFKTLYFNQITKAWK